MALHIPSVFPEPWIVPGNVADEAYGVRLAFVRKVWTGHTLLVGFATAVAVWAPRWGDLPLLGLMLLAILLGHQSTRRLFAGRAGERYVQFGLRLLLVPVLGELGAQLNELGWSVWIFALAAGGLGLYTLLCGHDFSFVGQAVLVGVSVLIAVAIWPGETPALTALAGLTYVVYLIYDLSMITKRRRADETGSAVMDLYGDCLNGVTYPIRLLQHWRQNAYFG